MRGPPRRSPAVGLTAASDFAASVPWGGAPSVAPRRGLLTDALRRLRAESYLLALTALRWRDSRCTDDWRRCTPQNRSRSLRYNSIWPNVPRQRLSCTDGWPDGTPQTCNRSLRRILRRRYRQRLSACTDRRGRYTPPSWSPDLRHSLRWRSPPRQRLSCRDGWPDGTPQTCNRSLRCTLFPHCRLFAPEWSYSHRLLRP